MNWNKILDITLAALKLVGMVILFILVGEFLTDFFGSKNSVKAQLKNFTSKIWKKSDDNEDHELVRTSRLDDEIIDTELNKLNSN